MLRIYGCSDDLVEVESDDSPTDVNEYSPPDGGAVRFTIGWSEAAIGRDAAGVEVTMSYGSMGVWSAEVGQMDDGAKIPWPITIGQHDGGRDRFYSVGVIVGCPPGTPVRVDYRKRNGEWKRYGAES